MFRLRSFQSRVFTALVLMAVVPAALTVGAGALAFREFGTTVGTLGPWDLVAESGQSLAERAVAAAPDDSSVAAAAAAHREALSESVRRSRTWTLLADRALTLLPFATLLLALTLTGMAFLVARWVSAGIARPIEELVGWTEAISRGEDLPSPVASEGGAEEFAVLRSSLREMDAELAKAREREVHAARLRAWTDMARRVAHELKNPLTPMRMAATTLARSGDARTVETATVMLEEIARLEEMARTFSQFGRMPEGPASEVDLVELTETLAGRQARKVEVEADPDIPLVHGHYDLLSRALRNLLVNADEAMTGSDDPVCVTVSRRALVRDTTTDGDRPIDGPAEALDELAVRGGGEIPGRAVDEAVVVRVADRGPGVREDLLETLWLPDVTTKRQGTGLGLAIVRQAADAHGGRVSVQNRDGGGAEFELILPVGGGAS